MTLTFDTCTGWTARSSSTGFNTCTGFYLLGWPWSGPWLSLFSQTLSQPIGKYSTKVTIDIQGVPYKYHNDLQNRHISIGHEFARSWRRIVHHHLSIHVQICYIKQRLKRKWTDLPEVYLSNCDHYLTLYPYSLAKSYFIVESSGPADQQDDQLTDSSGFSSFFRSSNFNSISQFQKKYMPFFIMFLHFLNDTTVCVSKSIVLVNPWLQIQRRDLQR